MNKKYNREMDKRLHPCLPKKGDLGITKNGRGTTLTAKIYNALLDCMKPENRKFLGKIRMVFGEIDSQPHRF